MCLFFSPLASSFNSRHDSSQSCTQDFSSLLVSFASRTFGWTSLLGQQVAEPQKGSFLETDHFSSSLFSYVQVGEEG